MIGLRNLSNRPVVTIIGFLIIALFLAATTVSASVRMTSAFGLRNNNVNSIENGESNQPVDESDAVGLSAQSPVSNSEMDTAPEPVTSMEGAFAIFVIAIFSLFIGYGIGRRQT